MWLINYLPGVPSFGVFIVLEVLVSLAFIYWVYISDHRWI